MQRSLVGTLVATGLGLTASGAAWARWSAPFEVGPPVAHELLPAQLDLGAGGSLAVGYAAQDVDAPAGSQAMLVWGAGRSLHAPLAIGGAQETLAVLAGSSGPLALVGRSPKGLACCSSVQAARVRTSGAIGFRHQLIGGLAGATIGRLLSSSAGTVAVVATERGVWAARGTASGNRFGRPTRLSLSRQFPQNMDAIVFLGGPLVVWAARIDRITGQAPASIYAAGAATRGGFGSSRPLVAVPAGHAVDELALAGGALAPTLAWIESWFDRRGGYHSVLKVTDVRRRHGIRTLSSGGELAAGLSFSGAAGSELVAWRGCSRSGACSARASFRRAGGSFGPTRDLGQADPSQGLATAVTSRGQGVVGWIRRGEVLGSSVLRGRWGAAAVVSATSYASDLTLAGGGAGAVALWTQGTFNESLVAAAFSG